MLTGKRLLFEEWSKRAAKARGTPRHRTACAPLLQRELPDGQSQFPFKVRCEKIEPLKNCAAIRFAQECWLPDPCAAIMGDERDDRLFALDVRA